MDADRSQLREISPPAGTPLRYTQRPFPPYRYVPGLHPHPVAHPDGHSFHPAGSHPPAGPLLEPQRWREMEDYLYGIDLYNGGYWWEAHEAWEGLWQQTDKAGRQGHFLQGIIQVSAAHLKRHVGQPEGVRRLLGRARGHLAAVLAEDPSAAFMGVQVADFLNAVQAYFECRTGAFPFLTAY
ncbi:MAG: hypothetical protein AMXMBFR13_30580 [Phycisphaerae bacterium]